MHHERERLFQVAWNPFVTIVSGTRCRGSTPSFKGRRASLYLSLSLLPSLTVVSFLLASPPPLWNAQTSKDVFATRAILLSLSPARKLPA